MISESDTRGEFRKKYLIPLVGLAAFLLIAGIITILFINIPAASDADRGSLNRDNNTFLNRAILTKSLELGTDFLLQNQKPTGNFNYEYNLAKRELGTDDNQVRQAGALWGMSLIYADTHTVETLDAVTKGINYMHEHSRQTENGARFVAYPGENEGKTGTVALVTLSLIELVGSNKNLPDLEKYQTELDQYLQFLLSLRKENGLFYGKYDLETGKGFGSPSPYSDGEALLAMAKTARILNNNFLTSLIHDSAEAMYQKYVVDALREDGDSDQTKGFYQWGTMAFYEIFLNKQDPQNIYAKRAIDLAHWMIDVHETLQKTRNTAYAQEGIITAWELARLIEDREAVEKFGNVVDQGLFNLSSWQVGSPLQNTYLKTINATQGGFDELSIGGIMNAKDDPLLRIDVTQHQMHAVMLARRYMYQTH